MISTLPHQKIFWKCPVAIHDDTATLSHCQKSISYQQETINHFCHLSWLGCPRHMSLFEAASTLKRKLVFPDASRDGVTGSVIATRPTVPATRQHRGGSWVAKMGRLDEGDGVQVLRYMMVYQVCSYWNPRKKFSFLSWIHKVNSWAFPSSTRQTWNV